MSSRESQWLILWCPTDTSYSLINASDVLCDNEIIAVGDSVKFFYDKTEWTGEVRSVGGDDDYEKLSKQLKVLNATNKKREDSFHEDRPRKAVQRFQNALAALKPKLKPKERVPFNNSTKQIKDKKPVSKNSEPSGSSGSKQRKQKKNTKDGKNKSSALHKLMLEVRSESSDSEADFDTDASPKSSPLPEAFSEKEYQEYQKLKRKEGNKGRESDLKLLKRLRTSQNAMNNNSQEDHEMSAATLISKELSSSPLQLSSSSLHQNQLLVSIGLNSPLGDEDGSSDENPFSIPDESLTPHGNEEDANNLPVNEVGGKISNENRMVPIFGARQMHVDSDNEDAPQNRSTPKEKPKRKKKEQQSTPQPAAQFQGTMLRCSVEEGAFEIRGSVKAKLSDKAFFITTQDMQSAKLQTTASTFARSLLAAAFTDEALYSCTLSGGQYRAAGRANIRQKPALDSNVIAVIVDVAIIRQANKKWKPEQDKKFIMSALRQKLVDMRPKLKKILEASEDAGVDAD